jgi:hypothetical protein
VYSAYMCAAASAAMTAQQCSHLNSTQLGAKNAGSSEKDLGFPAGWIALGVHGPPKTYHKLHIFMSQISPTCTQATNVRLGLAFVSCHRLGAGPEISSGLGSSMQHVAGRFLYCTTLSGKSGLICDGRYEDSARLFSPFVRESE